MCVLTRIKIFVESNTNNYGHGSSQKSIIILFGEYLEESFVVTDCLVEKAGSHTEVAQFQDTTKDI